ncbi:PQQ-binding-like beta-propeller repeat protein [Paludisphaera borealis]|uniref:PQQ-dependent dehydrogenase n=1 Tax=Paludisphaera borealis TaxID=1387353 RepID=A0A1U7CYL0_9BACT|nr:PQQ-binding-like beta-propeller repeat protein [Paludisphaera borealis]APW63978.1 PQQ-dependent dehydrogenase [Paludisphaera borealis]
MTWFRFHRRKTVAIPSRVVGVLSACLLATVAGSAAAQPAGRSASKFYPDSSEAAETLLRNAASHVRAGQWSEAVGIYQRVIEQYGDKVARLPRDPADGGEGGDEFVLYVDLRGYCQRTLAGLPDEARAVYRKRMDAQAERWFREGEAGRDAGPLRRVVEQAFCTSWGDDALELLGDLSFQDGRFGEALAMYRRLVADDPENPLNLVHPDPSVDLARVAAKKLLCRAAAGESLTPAVEIEAFAKRFPGASGPLAGRKGLLATSLAAALETDHLAPPSQSDGRWPTFAGSPTRNKIVAESIDVGSLQWRVALERISPVRAGGPYVPRAFGVNNGASSPANQLLGYHPIIVGDQVIVNNGSRITAYNLSDRPNPSEGGQALAVEPAWKHDPDDGAAPPQALPSSWAIPRYTLTAVGDRIYARMGSSSQPNFAGGPRPVGADSSIVAIDRNRPGGKPLWIQRSSKLTLPDRPAEQVGRSVNFEGTPVADDRSVYVAVTDRREQTATYVASYNADDGSLRWLRYLGAAASENDNFMAMGGMGFGALASADSGHRLLSLDGPVLYYQTNLGALAALDAETGSIRWAATYPRQESGRGQGGERDLNPAVVHDGLVFVAPSDASSIFAFEAQTGRLKWRTVAIPDEVKLSHLLGVAKGRLVATGDKVLWFDVRDGKLLHAWPDTGGSREGYGRGLLAGDRVYWPTRNEIQVLDQASGARSGPPIKLLETYRTTGGNLVAGDGYLVVAQSDGLVVFCQNSRLIERYRDEIARAPHHAPTHYRLARAAEAVGRDQLALDSYVQSIRNAGAGETIDGSPLIDAARDHQFRLLLRLAASLRGEKKYDDAGAKLEAAVLAARQEQDRLKARLLLADVQLERGRPPEAVDILERLLGDDRLQQLTVGSDDGRRAVRADLFVGDRLAEIVRDHGRKVYDSYDRKARELFKRGVDEQDARSLAEVARIFPVAEAVPEALLALGAVHESQNRPTAAAAVYKRLLTLSAPSDEARARALWRLARIYESQGYLVSARDAYLQMADRYPRLQLELGGRVSAVSERVSAELARDPLARIVADRPRPAVPSPMVRRWRWKGIDGADAARPLTAAGAPPAVDSSRVFLAADAGLSPLDPATGDRRWTAALGERAVWVGYLADKLLAATPHHVAAIDVQTGAIQWRFGRDGSARGRRGPDPFARDDPQPNPAATPGTVLHDFQIVAGRLFLLRGDDELIALDGDTGFINWSYTPRGGAINPKLWIGPARLVLQVDRPSELVVLETVTGRPISRCGLSEGEGLEREPTPIDEDHVIVVTDRRTVKKFDLERGQFVWDYRESVEMPVNGAPRAFVDAEHLMVIHDGRTLIRLDPATGSKQWSTVLGTEDLGERPDALAFDEQRFYCVSKQSLRALSLKDGSPLWSRHLSGRELIHWSLALSDRSVLVYPSLSSLWEEEVEAMPLVVCKQENGALVQRFVFPATIAEVHLRLDSRGAVIATPRELWALGARPPSREGRPSPTP